MRIQFPLRSLLLVTLVFAGLSLVGRWLAGLDPARARGILIAFAGGLPVGWAVCTINQKATYGKPVINSGLTVLVSISAWWFGNHFISFMLAMLVGVLVTTQKSVLLGYFFERLGFRYQGGDRD